MKRTVLSIIVIVFILVACAKKITPAETATPPKTTEPAVSKEAMGKDSSLVTMPSNPVEGMTSEQLIASGEVIFKAKCGRCHALKNPADYTQARWDAILKTMFPRANLNPTEQHQVLAYIKANAKM